MYLIAVEDDKADLPEKTNPEITDMKTSEDRGYSTEAILGSPIVSPFHQSSSSQIQELGVPDQLALKGTLAEASNMCDASAWKTALEEVSVFTC